MRAACSSRGSVHSARRHPVGATGIKQILEIYRQMKGKCGDYQLRQLPEFGLAANMGGEDKTAVVSILKNL